ncbi:MAG: FAD-dependent oxidoreductase [Thaumarchaeota archaeon S13]|nr:MAG: FAD-dependent oxidoreductase [Thaumarchaeota archaeon S13]
MARFDVAVIGAGVLGACVAYWISSTCRASVCVLEAGGAPALHASSRNTGVVHSPFYLEPRSRAEMASAMVASRPMWKRMAGRAGAPWREVGVLEVAVDDSQRSALERHARWGPQNGMADGDVELLDGREAAALEPNVRAAAALRCATEAATDFALLTRAVLSEAEAAGAAVAVGRDVTSITASGGGHEIRARGAPGIGAGMVINCAGARSLEVARMLGHGAGHTALHFRGEYWRAAREHASMVGTSVYSVPRYPEYPFLDPHWIVRADGGAEIGPNAVPVAAPAAYEGSGGARAVASKLREVASGGAARLLRDPAFLRMAAAEWRSSLSRSAMVSRIRAFVPAARPRMFTRRGMAGIRTPIVTREGRMATETMVEVSGGACSVLNYNSPGATGAPAWAARLVARLREGGHLAAAGRESGRAWAEAEALGQG